MTHGLHISGIIFVVVCLSGPVTVAAERPSFDCARSANATEKTICATARLARLDRQIATAYRQLKAELNGDEEFEQEQAEFLKQRDGCGTDPACLATKMETRRTALSLIPNGRDPREAFVGRYKNNEGWMIVRRTLSGDYELEGGTADQATGGARWVCDVSGKMTALKDGSATVEAGEKDQPHPIQLRIKNGRLVITEDENYRLAGYTCGANGYVDGEYRRTTRLRP